MKLKSAICGVLFALASLSSTVADAARYELGRFGHWDSYKLTFEHGVEGDPNIRWVCSTRGIFQDETGANYKVIFAFYNTGLAKFYIEDQQWQYQAGFQRKATVRVFDALKRQIFAASALYQNKSNITVKQIGYNANLDFIKAVFKGHVLQTTLPTGETMNFDISDAEFNQSLGTTLETCVMGQTEPLQTM